jgi:hypothetical protein
VDEKARNRLLTVLFVGVLMGALDIAIVGPALKVLRDFFHVGAGQAPGSSPSTSCSI